MAYEDESSDLAAERARADWEMCKLTEERDYLKTLTDREKPLMISHHQNTRYCFQFLRNSGERVRAIRLASDLLNMNVKEAAAWVDSLNDRCKVGG